MNHAIGHAQEIALGWNEELSDITKQTKWYIHWIDDPEEGEWFETRIAAHEHAKRQSAYETHVYAIRRVEDSDDPLDGDITTMFYDGIEFPRKRGA